MAGRWGVCAEPRWGDEGETETGKRVALGAKSIRNVLWASELWLLGGGFPISLSQMEPGMQLPERLARPSPLRPGKAAFNL